MVFFSNSEIEAWINEDAPLVDLTSHLLGISAQPATLTVRARQPVCVALTEEAGRLFAMLGAEVSLLAPSGRRMDKGETLLSVRGRADALHRGWKVAMNLLEHACGVATRTAEMVDKARLAANIPLLITRKHLPGVKKILVKSILAGGAVPHRLGLSETILIFENHLNVLGGRERLPELIAGMRAAACEKKIMVECDTLAQALQAIEAGADGIQFDKASPAQLMDWCEQIEACSPAVAVLAAGGIRPDNVEDYALSGVHGLVLSSVYHAPPADLEVRIVAL